MSAPLLILPLLLGTPGSAPAPQPAIHATQEADAATEEGPLAKTSVGMRVRLEEVPIPGSALRAKPIEDAGHADAIVRVLNVFPHGSSFRYNLEIMPLVPGTIDLREELERVDGSDMSGVPPLEIEVSAVLPGGVMEPNDLDIPTPDSVGGYRNTAIFLGVLWVLGLLALLFGGRRKGEEGDDGASAKPVTLADRLRPLVEGARSGEISNEERAELERLVLAHWRAKKDLGGAGMAQAVARLRNDEEAGPLLRQLEEWLHRPAGAGDAHVDVSALLEPYRKAPASAGGSAG